MDCYNVSLFGFCFVTVFPHVLFFKIIFVNFFYIELVENLTLTFPTCFFSPFFCYNFFKNYLCRFYFFNIKLIENLAL